ncbi:MAG: NTP transferase domain-containing protein [Ferrovibrio sp.]|nr:NTP transferase domain-containing protein [Ferrovibrio sp.]
MSRIIGVIQARMGSSRLPGKALLPLAGKPLVWHIIDRMRRVRGVERIVLATTTDPRNDSMIDFARSEGLEVFRHPVEDDIAGRIAGAIAPYPGDVVLKTGGDCPLIDPAVLQRMVDAGLNDPAADFISNRVIWTYPQGLSADVLSRRAIFWADENLHTEQDRELFATYLRDHPDQFKVVPITQAKNMSHLNWCVDTPEDMAFVGGIFDALYREGECFGLAETLAFLGLPGA